MGLQGVPGLLLHPAAPVTHFAFKNTSSSLRLGPVLPTSFCRGSLVCSGHRGPAPCFRHGLPGLHPSAPSMGLPSKGSLQIRAPAPRAVPL